MIDRAAAQPASLADGTRPLPGGWYALALVGAAQVVSMLDRNILAILAPAIKADLGIGDAEMGLLYGTVFALFYALFSLPLGRLADGWIRTRLLSVSIFFWSLSTAAAAFAGGFLLLALSRLGVGIGEASAQPAGTSLLYDYFPKRRRGLVMAVFASAIALGLGGSLMLGGFAADWWNARHAASGAPLGLAGWQFAFLVAAMPGFAIAALMWRLREPERGAIDGIVSPPDPAPFRASINILTAVTPGANWITLARARAGAGAWTLNLGILAAILTGAWALIGWAEAFSPRPPLKIGGAAVSPHLLQWSVVGFGVFVVANLLQTLRRTDRPAFAVIGASPSVLMCVGVGACQSVISYGVMGFTPSFLMASYGLSPSAVGLQFGILAVVLGVAGPLIAGPLSDRVSRGSPRGRVWVTLFALGVSPLLAPWVYAASDAASFYLRFSLYSLVLTMWLPPLYAVLYDLVLPRMRGMTVSFYFVVQTIFGLGIGPYAVGMVSDARGGDLAGAIVAVNLVAPVSVALLIALLLRVGRDQEAMVARARAAGEPI
ncbi:MFS transporter [Sphingomonas baiyangensis]|uniref:MFS transporter n=1 Tax=Sphingomonas baiyangensis TaxID=2572576 RepID=A0A4U1L1S1_9SPHN|nr:MFS transporter [Sphingomonas baiyangensis]TKD49885.1 MFS transporter [Sphingomonas baiyangensis]